VTDNVTRDGCPGVCTKTVVVNPNPTCEITPSTPVCLGTTNVYTSTVLPGGGVVTHFWTITGGGYILGSNTGSSVTVVATNAGTFTLTDNVTRNGCPGVCTRTITVSPNPTCTIAGPNGPLCVGTTNTYTSTVLPAGGVVTHFWTVTGSGQIVGSNTGASVQVRATGPGPFTVIDNVTRDGCPGVCNKTVTVIPCNPQICVTKEVVCETPAGCETNWSKYAEGVRSLEECPLFCYRIITENCGQDVLTNVTVIDNVLGNIASYPLLAIGQRVTNIVSSIEHCVGVTNTVTATGTGQASGITTNDLDMAAVAIKDIDIQCTALINGQSMLVLEGCDQTNPTMITNSVRICNTGDLPLWNIKIQAPAISGLGGECAAFTNLSLALEPGECVTIDLCVDAVVCPADCKVAFGFTATVTGTVDLSKTNVCAWTKDEQGVVKAISVTTECSAEVVCTPPSACRTTGGGRQNAPLAYPANVRYVTHGGQVGAPVGNKVCEVTEDFYLGNPCIHGRWTHVRHEKGGLRGNFHARYYDTLDCACLDITTTPEVVTIGNQTYTNLVYGLGTVTGGVCNKDDRKVAGPQPRPAGANKIVFTGVGDWADPNGRRAPRATLFRVDLEDRSEPGGSHPNGSVPPADRYRIRIWVLTPAELAQLRGGAGDRYLLSFRNAISACNGINVVDGATVANGAAAFGVRAPDIDDGGELERGNHQIHPSIKACDPYNPTGPGLPPKGN